MDGGHRGHGKRGIRPKRACPARTASTATSRFPDSATAAMAVTSAPAMNEPGLPESKRSARNVPSRAAWSACATIPSSSCMTGWVRMLWARPGSSKVIRPTPFASIPKLGFTGPPHGATLASEDRSQYGVGAGETHHDRIAPLDGNGDVPVELIVQQFIAGIHPVLPRARSSITAEPSAPVVSIAAPDPTCRSMPRTRRGHP